MASPPNPPDPTHPHPFAKQRQRGEGKLPTWLRPSSVLPSTVPVPLANWVWSHNPSPQVSQPLPRVWWLVGQTCEPERCRWGPTERLVLGFRVTAGLCLGV